MASVIFNTFKKRFLNGEVPHSDVWNFIPVKSDFKTTFTTENYSFENFRTLEDFSTFSPSSFLFDKNNAVSGGNLVLSGHYGNYFYEKKSLTSKTKPLFVTKNNMKGKKANYDDFINVYYKNVSGNINNINKYCEKANGNGFYYITDVGELEWFADRASTGNNRINGVLGFDISGNPAVVIGTEENYPYEGIFDGNGYSWINPSVECSRTDNGLFGIIGKRGVVRNIILKHINGTEYRTSLKGRKRINLKHIATDGRDINCALLAGRNYGRIERVDASSLGDFTFENFIPEVYSVTNKSDNYESFSGYRDKYDSNNSNYFFPNSFCINSPGNACPYVGFFNAGIFQERVYDTMNFPTNLNVSYERNGLGEMNETIMKGYSNNLIFNVARERFADVFLTHNYSNTIKDTPVYASSDCFNINKNPEYFTQSEREKPSDGMIYPVDNFFYAGSKPEEMWYRPFNHVIVGENKKSWFNIGSTNMGDVDPDIVNFLYDTISNQQFYYGLDSNGEWTTYYKVHLSLQKKFNGSYINPDGNGSYTINEYYNNLYDTKYGLSGTWTSYDRVVNYNYNIMKKAQSVGFNNASANKYFPDFNLEQYPSSFTPALFLDPLYFDKVLKPHRSMRQAYYISPIVGANYGQIDSVNLKTVRKNIGNFVGFIGGVAGKFERGTINNVNIDIQDSFSLYGEAESMGWNVKYKTTPIIPQNAYKYNTQFSDTNPLHKFFINYDEEKYIKYSLTPIFVAGGLFGKYIPTYNFTNNKNMISNVDLKYTTANFPVTSTSGFSSKETRKRTFSDIQNSFGTIAGYTDVELSELFTVNVLDPTYNSYKNQKFKLENEIPRNKMTLSNVKFESNAEVMFGFGDFNFTENNSISTYNRTSVWNVESDNEKVALENQTNLSDFLFVNGSNTNTLFTDAFPFNVNGSRYKNDDANSYELVPDIVNNVDDKKSFTCFPDYSAFSGTYNSAARINVRPLIKIETLTGKFFTKNSFSTLYGGSKEDILYNKNINLNNEFRDKFGKLFNFNNVKTTDEYVISFKSENDFVYNDSYDVENAYGIMKYYNLYDTVGSYITYRTPVYEKKNGLGTLSTIKSYSGASAEWLSEYSGYKNYANKLQEDKYSFEKTNLDYGVVFGGVTVVNKDNIKSYANTFSEFNIKTNEEPSKFDIRNYNRTSSFNSSASDFSFSKNIEFVETDNGRIGYVFSDEVGGFVQNGFKYDYNSIHLGEIKNDFRNPVKIPVSNDNYGGILVTDTFGNNVMFIDNDDERKLNGNVCTYLFPAVTVNGSDRGLILEVD